MKKLWTLVVVVGLFGWLMGCASSKSLDSFGGGNNGGGGAQGTSGNWDIRLTSGTSGSTVGFGGQLTFNGSTVTGNLVPYSDNTCFYPSLSTTSVAVSGTVSNNSLTLNIATGGGTFVVTFAIPSGSFTTLTGTYTVASGCLGSAVAGNVSASQISGALSGTWTGTDTSGTGAVLSFDFNVANTTTATGSLQGTFAITPVSVTFTPPSGCVVSGTTLNATSYAAGEFLFLDVAETENGVPSEFLIVGVVDSATTPANFGGAYSYVSGGSCLLSTSGASFTMAKQ